MEASSQHPANFSAYVINLDSAKGRWEHMKSQLAALDVPYVRIEAVLGRDLTFPDSGFNEKKFQILTGKQKNPAEIGCYMSHLKAFREFLKTASEWALILEDDVTLPSDINDLLSRAMKHRHAFDVLRLTSSREGDYLDVARLDVMHLLAYNTRVLKNTGAYLINRKAAQACVAKMLPMCLPYDVALDRDWDFGFKTACIVPFPVKLEAFDGQIPKAPRVRRYRATTFHLFHWLTRLQRIYFRRKYAEQSKRGNPRT